MDSNHSSLQTLHQKVLEYEPLCPADQTLPKWLSMSRAEDGLKYFTKTLSVPQRNSCQLLLEWLDYLASIGANLQQVLSLRSLSDTWDPSSWDIIEPDTRPFSDTTYHIALSHLLFVEFAPWKPEKEETTLIYVSILRYQAAIYAAAYRISIEIYHEQKSGPVQSAECVEGLPDDVIDAVFYKIDACIDSCSWLSKDDHQELPFYLWDCKAKATVCVQDLPTRPLYAAVSHTWGRWQKRDVQTQQPMFATVNGVFWPVPENTKFDVQILPNILDRLAGIEYVWLDLLCIPQDDSPLALKEISRQAAIFRNSAVSIAWMNDVTGWHGLQTALRWMCTKYINTGAQDEFLQKGYLDEVPIVPDLNIELITRCQESRSGMNDDLMNPWFTSLWTLQELCLCPGMLLCDKFFTPLRLGNGLLPISFADIQALFWCLKDTQVPELVSQLFSVYARSGLTGLFKMNPAMVLRLGDLRQCEKRRAEAIMSAVGAVNWFPTSATARAIMEQPEQLILGRYPLAFICELRTKMGSGSFFSEGTLKFEALLKLLYFKLPLANVTPVGSMLPFGDGKPANPTATSFRTQDDPSIGSWEVDMLGMVLIREAFIQFPNEVVGHTTSMKCMFVAPLLTSNSLNMHSYHGPLRLLQTWIRCFQPATANFAIRLQGDGRRTVGALIKQLQPGLFIKVGVYTIFKPKDVPDIGRRERMDWIVV